MRTACSLRRSWLQLHAVCQGIPTGSSRYAISSCRRTNSQDVFFIMGERLSSTLSSDKPAEGRGGQSRSPFPSSRRDHYQLPADSSAFHQEEGFKFFPSRFRSRATGGYGLFSSIEGDSTRNQGTSVKRRSTSWNELSVHTEEDRDEEGQAKEPVGKGLEDDDMGLMRMRELGDTIDTNVSLKRRVEFEDPKHLKLPNESPRPGRQFGSRQLFVHQSSAELTRHVFSWSTFSNGVFTPSHCRSYSSLGSQPANPEVSVDADKADTTAYNNSHRAVVTALACNFVVFALKLGVWIMTSSHVMLAEAIHSLADLANQGLIAYGLVSSRRAPDALHPYGYTKERFVWSLISAVGIFCIGAGATVIHGLQNLWTAEPLENIYLAALVIAGSMVMEGGSLLVAISCVRNGARAEGMTVKDYLWRGHDPTSVAVMMEDGAAVTGLAIAGLALTAAHYTGNPIWDPIGSIVVGNLLGAVAIFLIQRNRHALLGRSMDEQDMMRVLNLLSKDRVVDAIYDCKSEVIGPGAYRFKAEIDFNGVTIVQNYIQRAGRGNWHKEFKDAVSSPEPGHLDRVMAAYGEEVVSALGEEVDRLEREIQKVVPGIRHVDIEAHNPNGPLPREQLYLPYRSRDK